MDTIRTFLNYYSNTFGPKVGFIAGHLTQVPPFVGSGLIRQLGKPVEQELATALKRCNVDQEDFVDDLLSHCLGDAPRGTSKLVKS